MSVKPRGGLVCQLAAATIAALSLVACGSSSSAPKSLPQLPNTTATPPASPSPTPTTLSKKAELAAATAVVKRYYSLLNAATTVHNASLIEDLMVKDCSCRRVAHSTSSVARQHKHYYGRTTVTALKPTLDGPGVADVLVRYDFTDTGIKTNSGRTLTHVDGRVDNQIDVRLALVNSQWLISELQVLGNGNPA
jgi:uncharacterized lipoprotein YmbA